MMNFNKNELINNTLRKYYESFECTLDTADYVPEKYNEKICKYIFKNLKRTFRKIDIEDRKYQRKLKKIIRLRKKLQKKQKNNKNKNRNLHENKKDLAKESN